MNTRSRVTVAVLVGGIGLSLAPAASAACPPEGESRASLQALKAARWAPPEGRSRDALALALADCLGDADPELRDGLAFEALSAWMRGGALAEATLQSLRLRLTETLRAAPDREGFAQPFAALTLAEVARVDRLKSFLTPAELADVLDIGTRYLSGVRDYRGFDPVQGWRHGVAHGADLMLQLSLNPRLQPEQARAIAAAVASQVMPAGEQAWRFGESERLMAPIFYLARRDLLSGTEWSAWFDALEARRLPGRPPGAVALAQRHNLVAFASALYVAVQENGQPAQRERLLPGLRKLLVALG